MYDTLGVCSQCEDVSHLLKFDCLKAKIDWPVDLDGPDGRPRENGIMCGYFLNATSQDPTLMSGYLVNNGTPGETLMMRTLPLSAVPSFNPLYGNGSIYFKELRNTISDVIIVSAESVADVRQNKTPIAQECALSWCVKRIRSLYFEGTYREEITGVIQNTTEGPYPWYSEFFKTDYESGYDSYYLQNISINTGTEIYGLANTTAQSVISAFVNIFPSFSTWRNSSVPILMRYKTWRNAPAEQLLVDFNPWLAPNNVSRHMERFATAMTNAIRSDSSRSMLEGQSYDKETFIVVKWEWLSFPFLLLLLSFVFLVSTIVKTSGDEGVGFWKTSAMPALIYSLPKEAQSQFASSETWNSAGVATKRTRIKLVPNSGWRISGQSYLSRSPRLPSGERVPRGWI